MPASGLELQRGAQGRAGLTATERRLSQQAAAQSLCRDGYVPGGKCGFCGCCRVLHRLVQPLSQSEQHPPEVVVGSGEQLLVSFSLEDGLSEERLRGAQVVVVATHKREPDQRMRAGGTAFQRPDNLLEHAARPLAVTALEEAEGCSHGAPAGVAAALRWCEPRRPVVEITGRGRRAAPLRVSRRVLECTRDPLVRAG